ncbi:MAG: AraC family ligand binding domain-containing protein, partial [Anaerolineales bacterium]|nr:AraC family ligand binding domain-containing protein [Anaerolineales bacterium]
MPIAGFVKNLYDYAIMTIQPHHRPFSFGQGINNRSNPHRIDRPNGTDLWILEYTVSGKGWIRCNGKITITRAGDIVIFRAGVPQDYGMDPQFGAWNHFWVCFKPRPQWLDWLNWPELGPGILHLVIPAGNLRRRFQHGFEKALSLMQSSLKHREDFGMNILEEILLWCDTVNPNSDQALLDPRIRRVLDAVCQQYSRPWSLLLLARVACLSLSHFAHLFKAQLGQSPQKWLEA